MGKAALTTYKWTHEKYHQAIDSGVFAGRAPYLWKSMLCSAIPNPAKR